MSKRKEHIDSRTRNAKILRTLVLCLCGCALFCAGFLIRDNDALMARVGWDTSSSSSSTSVQTSGVTTEVALRLSEVEDIIVQSSLDSYDVEAAATAVLEAFIASTEDSYSCYFDDDRYSTYVDVSTAEEYPGVGVFFSENDGQAYALDVFEGSPAAEAGVTAGDVVIAIDGDRSQTWTSTEVINAVQLAAGSSIVITWQRTSSDGEVEEFNTTLESSDFTEANVSIELVDNIGYISLTQFTQNADTLVREAIETLTEQGAEAFVLDLRDNPGGYLNKAVDVASLFIESGVVVEVETNDATTTKEVSGDIATTAPVVLLVNSNTSGAAEVLAAAMRDADRATIVGTTTMGKGSVQVIKSLSFGGAIRYTAALYKSPSGYDIDGVGVSPDITVSASEDDEEDTQKEIALDAAASLVTSTSDDSEDASSESDSE